MITFVATKKLKEIRSEKFSQREMAELMSAILGRNWGRSHYSLVELGIKQVSTDTAIKIAQVLEVPIDDIFISKEVAARRSEGAND